MGWEVVPHPALTIIKKYAAGARRETGFIFGQEHSAEGFNGWANGKLALDKGIAESRGKALPAWRLPDIRRSVVTHFGRAKFCAATRGGP